MTLRNALAVTIAAAAICCFGAPDKLVAASTQPIITYVASGTLTKPATSGIDALELAGEPFSLSISVSADTVPFEHGVNWCAYNKLKITGVVHSGLLGTAPATVGSAEASIIQAVDPGQFDQITLEAPIKITKITLTLKAVIVMPNGTIQKSLLYPFGTVVLAPGNSVVTVSDGTDTSVYAVQSGTLTATLPSGTAGASAAPSPDLASGRGR